MGTEGLPSRVHTPTNGPQIPPPSRVARACQDLEGGSDAWGIDGPRAGGGGGTGGGGVGKGGSGGGSVSPPSIVPPLHVPMLEAAAKKIWLQEEAAGVGTGGSRFVRGDEAREQEKLQKDAKCVRESQTHMGRPRKIEGGQEQEEVGGEGTSAVEDIRARARQRLQQRRQLFDVCICTHARTHAPAHTRAHLFRVHTYTRPPLVSVPWVYILYTYIYKYILSFVYFNACPCLWCPCLWCLGLWFFSCGTWDF